MIRSIGVIALSTCLLGGTASACDRYVTGGYSFDFIYEPVRMIRDEQDRSWLVGGCGTGISGMCAHIPGKPGTAFQFEATNDTLQALGREYRCAE